MSPSSLHGAETRTNSPHTSAAETSGKTKERGSRNFWSIPLPALRTSVSTPPARLPHGTGHSQAPHKFPVGAVCPEELPWGRAGGSLAPQLLQTGSTCRGAQTCRGTPAGPVRSARSGPIPTGTGTGHSGAGHASSRHAAGKGSLCPEAPAVGCQCLAVSPLHTKSPAQNRSVRTHRSTALPGTSRDTHGRECRYRRRPVDG